jgi:hypothetical protein
MSEHAEGASLSWADELREWNKAGPPDLDLEPPVPVERFELASVVLSRDSHTREVHAEVTVRDRITGRRYTVPGGPIQVRNGWVVR